MLNWLLSFAEKQMPDIDTHVLHELQHTLQKERIRSFEIGILSRRAVEFMLKDLSELGTMPGVLWKQIEESAEWGIASWVRSYMHVLRLFGNESAYEKKHIDQQPSEMDASDLAVCLFCLQRVVSFWETARET